MAEKRSLFKNIFGAGKDKASLTRLQVLSGYTPVFTPWSKNPYDADAVRSAVDAIARNAAKLKAKHIRRTGSDIIQVQGSIEKLLQVRPNQNMSAYDFFYKLITTLLIENNAYAYPVWDGANLTAIWPINCTMTEFMEDNSGRIFVKFNFADGNTSILPYAEIIHLRRHYYKADMVGDENKAINNTLDVIHTTNEGIAQAIKTSANLRGIIKFQGMLKDSDIKASRDRFVGEYMTMQNTGGIAALDSKADYTELNSDPKIINSDQMKELRDTVYRYFGVNENIVMGNRTDEQWDAFYESTIEPLAVQMSLEFTHKLFTDREQGHGNEIIFEANRLQYSNVKTKVAMVQQLIPMGMMTINEGREIFNMAPVEGGDKRLISLNFVSADKADLYQVGEGDSKNDNQGQTV